MKIRFVAVVVVLLLGGAFSGAAVSEVSSNRMAWVDSRGRLVTLPLDAVREGRLIRFDGGPGSTPAWLGDGLLLRLQSGSDTVPAWMLSAAGLRVERRIDVAGTTWLCRASDPEGVMRASRVLSGMTGVRWALPDFRIRFLLHSVPADPFWDRQWPLNPAAGGGHIDVGGAWAVTTGDPSVVVAIIDTGVDTGHPDLGPERFVYGYNYVEDVEDPSPGDRAAAAHGTHCAGIIGALHNEIGIAGLCPGCRLAGYRFLTGLPGDEHVAELSNAAGALRDAADSGAWIISNSWGIYNVNKPKIDMAPILEAAEWAASNGGPDGQGSLVVFSSGNQMGYDEQTDTTFALKIASDDLAALPGVVAVGAVDPEGVRQDYSQWGPQLDLVAPGGAYAATGAQIVTLDTSGTVSGKGNGANKGDGVHYVSAGIGDVTKTNMPETDTSGLVTAYFNGTSSSAPFVAGVAALVWSADLLDGTRDLSASDVRDILIETADRTADAVWVDGRNDEYGHGRVNAERAVLAALGQEMPDDVPPDAGNGSDLSEGDVDESEDSIGANADDSAPDTADSTLDRPLPPFDVQADLISGDENRPGNPGTGCSTSGASPAALPLLILAAYAIIRRRFR